MASTAEVVVVMGSSPCLGCFVLGPIGLRQFSCRNGPGGPACSHEPLGNNAQKCAAEVQQFVCRATATNSAYARKPQVEVPRPDLDEVSMARTISPISCCPPSRRNAR